MPIKAPTICKHPGCGLIIRSTYCEPHQAAADQRKKQGQQDYNGRRAESDRRYSTSKWKALSITFRKRKPLCANCEDNDRVRPAVLVDHIKSAKEHPELFYEWRNLRSLCQRCHNQIGEKVFSKDAPCAGSVSKGEGRV
ncbi:MAG: HNH endonuclease [Oleispira sp.]|nr:HNH endonuclease [Oleispira sp.]